MRVGVAAGVVLCVAAVSADAQEPIVETATIVEFGLFAVSEPNELVFDPKSMTGFVQTYKKTRLIDERDLVCPQRGARFGVRFKLHGSPHLAPIPITLRTVFPPVGLLTPRGERHASTEHTADRKIGQNWTWMFVFSQDWHIVPGTWAFEVRYANRLLARKEFDVQCIVN